MHPPKNKRGAEAPLILNPSLVSRVPCLLRPQSFAVTLVRSSTTRLE